MDDIKYVIKMDPNAPNSDLVDENMSLKIDPKINDF